MMRKVFGTVAWAVVLLGILCGVATAGENMLKNPGFEEGEWESWSTFGMGWSLSDEYVASGMKAIVNEVGPRDGDRWRGVFQEVDVIPGQMYRMTADIRTRSLDNATVYLEVQFLDGAGNVVEQYQSEVVRRDQVFLTSELGPLFAPVGAVRASVRGIVQKDAKANRPTNDTVFFDDFTFEHVEI